MCGLVFCSGTQKLQSFNVTTGGPVMSLMAPKMDTFLGHIKDAVKIDIPLEKVLDTLTQARCFSATCSDLSVRRSDFQIA